MMFRIITWAIALALIGAFLAGKSAVIEPIEIVKGAVIGGTIGCVIGACFYKSKKSKNE